ncbi:methyl-accepting chemotaxis protein [Bacillus thuringiensis]|nr:methyl-accepting chemotaxis protein [Bacillus thuringiensis]MCU7667303.1 methyl-accepting chemotaxis protein [Bacillus thuringiensis]
MNIKAKFIAVSTGLLIISNTVIGLMSYHQANKELDAMGRIVLKNATNQAIAEMTVLNNQVKKGTITLEQAKEEAATSILGPKKKDSTRDINKEIDLGKNGYLYVISPKGDLVVHPNKEGQNIYNSKDVDGNSVGKMVVEAASKDGFSQYDWELPSKEGNEAKIVYSQEFKDWGWIVAAGTYKMDFNAAAKDILEKNIIVSLLTIVIGTGFVFYYSTRISKALHLVKRRLERVAEGDLSSDALILNTKDETKELADSLNVMSSNLRTLISSVGQSARELSSASEETASSIEEITSSAERINEIIQFVALEAQNGQNATIEATRAIDGLNDLLEEAKTRTLNGSEISKQTMETAQTGAKNVKELVSRMSEIEVKTEQTQEVIKELEKYSQEISKITNTITDIAAQTNLLALNAAIEAARAGEHGKGFSVVADEVRKLSEKSNEGANQVAALTQKINELTKKSAKEMEESRKIVGEGVESAHTAGKSLEEILEAVNNTVNEMKNITNLTEEEVESANQILDLIKNLSEVSEKIAASSQEATASAEETTASIQSVSAVSEENSGMANELNVSVEKFKV